MSESFIGLDLGTSNLKGVLIHGSSILAKEVRANTYQYGKDHHVEFDAEEYFSRVWDLIDSLAKQSPVPVKGIACCAASGNTLLLTPEGKACTQVISWLDLRPVELDLPIGAEELHQIVGWPQIPCFPLVHLQYFKEQGLLEGKRVAMSNDFVTLRLTGNHVLDHSSGTPFYLIDQKKRSYCPELLKTYGLTEERLPHLAESTSVIGTLLPQFQGGMLTADTVVFCGSFDHPSAARALGLAREDEILLSCGSSWVIFEAVKERTIQPGTLSDPYLSGDKTDPLWGRMRSLSKAGLLLEEFTLKTFGNTPQRYELLERNLEKSEVKTFLHDLLDRFGAILPQKKIKTIYMVGGAAKSGLFPKLIAQRFSCNVCVPDYHLFAGSVGAARMAGSEKLPLQCQIYTP